MLLQVRYAIHWSVLSSALGILFSGVACPAHVHPLSGREIAPVMSVEGAAWLDREERGREEQPDRAIRALQLKPGMRVGDVGAGTGFYSFRMAKLVSPGGRVYANDLQSEMLNKIAAKARAQSITNVEEVKGTDSNCNLPPGALDLVILVDVYHEFSKPQEMLRSIHRSLKNDGRIVLLEYRGEDESVPILPAHKMTLQQVKTEVIPEGFRFEKTVETMPWQHIIFFRKAGRNED